MPGLTFQGFKELLKETTAMAPQRKKERLRKWVVQYCTPFKYE